MIVKEIDPKKIEKLLQREDFLLFIKSEHCYFCKTLFDKFKQLSEDISAKIRVYIVNVSKHRDWGIENRITSVPQIWIYRDGKKVYEHIGDTESVEELENIISTHFDFSFFG